MGYQLRLRRFWTRLIVLVLPVFPVEISGYIHARDLNRNSSMDSVSGSIVLYSQKYRPQQSKHIELLDPKSLQLRSFALLRNEVPIAGRVAPNGKRLAATLVSERDGASTTEVMIIDAENRRTTIAKNAEVVAWSPDSTRILLRQGEKYKWDHRLIDVGNGASEDLPLPKTDAVTDWSPDGATISVMAGRPDRIFEQRPGEFYSRRQLCLYNLETRAAQQPFTHPDDDCIKGMFSRDGTTLAYLRRTYSTGKPVELCEITHINSGKSSTLVNFTELGVRPNGSPFWSPDGKTLVWQIVRQTIDDNVQCELWFLFTDGSPRRSVVERDLNLDFFRVIDWR